MRTTSDRTENEPVRCPVCGEIVGVYERAIFATPDGQHLVGSPLTLSVELGSDNRVVHAAWLGR